MRRGEKEVRRRLEGGAKEVRRRLEGGAKEVRRMYREDWQEGVRGKGRGGRCRSYGGAC